MWQIMHNSTKIPLKRHKKKKKNISIIALENNEKVLPWERDKTRMPAILLLFSIILIITDILANSIAYTLHTHAPTNT